MTTVQARRQPTPAKQAQLHSDRAEGQPLDVNNPAAVAVAMASMPAPRALQNQPVAEQVEGAPSAPQEDDFEPGSALPQAVDVPVVPGGPSPYNPAVMAAPQKLVAAAAAPAAVAASWSPAPVTPVAVPPSASSALSDVKETPNPAFLSAARRTVAAPVPAPAVMYRPLVPQASAAPLSQLNSVASQETGVVLADEKAPVDVRGKTLLNLKGAGKWLCKGNIYPKNIEKNPSETAIYLYFHPGQSSEHGVFANVNNFMKTIKISGVTLQRVQDSEPGLFSGIRSLGGIPGVLTVEFQFERELPRLKFILNHSTKSQKDHLYGDLNREFEELAEEIAEAKDWILRNSMYVAGLSGNRPAAVPVLAALSEEKDADKIPNDTVAQGLVESGLVEDNEPAGQNQDAVAAPEEAETGAAQPNSHAAGVQARRASRDEGCSIS